MKATASALILAAALLSAACGTGRAIFNVDVYSFLAGTGKDTIPYAIPPLSSGTVSNTPQQISLPPGFGSSIVDSARITGTADLRNATGAGTVSLQIFLAADSQGTFNAPDTIGVAPASVSGTTTTPVIIAGDLTNALNLFNQGEVWIRIAATGNNPGATPVTGNMVLTALLARIVLQEKIL